VLPQDVRCFAPALALWLDLHSSSAIPYLLNTSATDIRVLGNGNSLHIALTFIGQAQLAKLGFTLTDVNVQWVLPGRVVSLHSLATDYGSALWIGEKTTIEVLSRFTIGGEIFQSREAVSNFLFNPECDVTIDNAEFLPIILMNFTAGFALTDGLAKIEFSDVPFSQKVQFRTAVSVVIDSIGGPSSIELVFHAGPIILSVRRGWADSSNRPTISGNAQILELRLAEPASFTYSDMLRIRVTSDSLRNMSLMHIEKAEVVVTSSDGIEGFLFRTTSLNVRGIQEVQRDTFVGNLTFVLAGQYRCDLGDGIPPNVVLSPSSGSTLTFAAGFGGCSSANRIVVTGANATLVFEGGTVPTVVDIKGTGMNVVLEKDQKNLPGWAIVIIVIGIAAVAALAAYLAGRYRHCGCCRYGRMEKAEKTDPFYTDTHGTAL
jgi:hypothetical protein